MEGEGAAAAAEDVPPANGEEPTRPSAESLQGNPLPGTPQNLGDSSDPKPPLDRNEIFRALEIVERDSTAIAESFASLFSSLRLALSEGCMDAEAETSDAEKKDLEKHSLIKDKANLKAKPGRGNNEPLRATSTSVENMQCFSEVVGRLQESALDAASKGNRYINSCLRLNEEMKSLETLSMQLKILKKNVDSLDLAVNRLLRLP